VAETEPHKGITPLFTKAECHTTCRTKTAGYVRKTLGLRSPSPQHVSP
jgi:hypothetical protein